jgi:hypothetical protein
MVKKVHNLSAFATHFFKDRNRRKLLNRIKKIGFQVTNQKLVLHPAKIGTK